MTAVDAHGPVADGFLARLAAAEDILLGPLAVRSAMSAGRLHPEPEECSLRSPFQRDRDRIVHCKAFRRLKHKTQVFIAPEGDHYRTRLTHTIEATGISRTVARALRLNEDLTEAIGLGHDLGHPPFGHAGEAALDGAVRGRFDRPFRHNEHSLRVVDHLERDGRGLNLTHEVRDGILTHTRATPPRSLEGRDRADRRPRRLHQSRHRRCPARGSPAAGRPARGADPAARRTGSRRIDTLVHDLVESSEVAGDIVQSPRMGDAMLELRTFLFARVYEQGPTARGDRARGARRAHALRRTTARRLRRDGLAGETLAMAVSTRSRG